MALHFLMCSERSGSNFVTKLLNGHSNICGPNTKHIINPVARNLFRYEPIENQQNWNELLEDINVLLNVDFSVWKSTFTTQKLNDLAPVGDIQSLIRNIFYEEAKQDNKQHVFVKENHVYEFLPFLLLNFPESKYIYQVRDPRDMALSWKKSLPHPGGVIKGAKQWKKDQQQLLKNYNELVKHKKAAFVRYEDLIVNPEVETKRLIEFLGLEYESEMMLFYQDTLTQENAQKIKAWKNLSKNIISDNKNKYLKELTDKEIKYIEQICKYEMQYLGYELQNSITALKRIREEELAEYEAFEQKNVPHERSEGVKANMKAKKRMYTKKTSQPSFLPFNDR